MLRHADAPAAEAQKKGRRDGRPSSEGGNASGRRASGALALLDRPIAFHRVFVNLTGSVTAALLLSQAVYWQRRMGEGWWYKTREEWCDETGMSPKELDNARRALRRHGWWHEARKGVPARVWYRVDLHELMAALEELEPPDPAKPDSPKGEAQIRPKGESGIAQRANLYTETTTETTHRDSSFLRKEGRDCAPDGALPADAGPPISPTERGGKLRKAVEIWNRVCGDVLPRVQKLTRQRQTALRKRLEEDCGGSLETWQAYCERIRSSPFLCGDNDRGWRASLDFALRPSTFARVLEGVYERAQGAAEEPRDPWVRAALGLVAEERGGRG